MSAETESKNETQSKLMDETDGTVSPSYQTQDPETGVGISRNNRQRSLMQRTRSVHLDFSNTIKSLCCDTIIGTIGLIIGNLFQVVCIVMGSVYLRDCPSSPGIPIILIILGVVGIVTNIINRIGKRDPEFVEEHSGFINALMLVSLATFIAWMVIVYKATYPTYDDPNDENYCNKTVFLFAFWSLNTILIIFGSAIFIVCCCFCCSAAIK